MKPGVIAHANNEGRYDLVEGDDGGEMQKSMEQVVQEFNVVKQVLLNNSIPVNLNELSAS